MATAVPTYVRHGAQPEASLLVEARGTAPRERSRWPTSAGTSSRARRAGRRADGARVRRRGPHPAQDPRRRPGPGGHARRRRPRLGARRREPGRDLDGRRGAVRDRRRAGAHPQRGRLPAPGPQLCPTVACVLTKTDFYPAWRRIRDLDEQHLAAHCPVPLMAVSSPLRSRAVKANDAGLNTESGFPDLVKFVNEQVGGSAAHRLAAEAAAEVAALCDQLEAQFEAERAALADPEAAQRVVDELTAVKSRVDALKTAAAKWNQTLSDGIADLTSDIDHDLRARIRMVIAEADTRDRGGRPGRHLGGDGALAAGPARRRAAGQLRAAARPGDRAERAGRRALPRGRRRAAQPAAGARPDAARHRRRRRAQDRPEADAGGQAGDGRAEERVRRRPDVHHSRQHGGRLSSARSASASAW